MQLLISSAWPREGKVSLGRQGVTAEDNRKHRKVDACHLLGRCESLRMISTTAVVAGVAVVRTVAKDSFLLSR